MRARSLIRMVGTSLVALGAAAAVTLSGAGTAQAATTSQNLVHSAIVGTARFASTTTIELALRSTANPLVAVSCIVSFPNATTDFSSGEISWTAYTQCSVPLSMQGTTVLYQWGSSSAFAFGNAYNAFTSFSRSSGNIFGIFSGTWGINHNVLLTLPAGDTTTPGAGCAYVNSAHTQIECHETTGPFSMQ